MKRTRGYGSYRGQSGFRTFLKVLIAVLAVVLILLVAGYFFLQRFAVVTDEGVRYDIPFLRPAPTPTPSLPPIVMETPSPSPTPTPTPTPDPTPTHAVLLPITDKVEVPSGDAAMFDMKRDDGLLGYVSDLPLAKDLKSSSADAALNAAIQKLTGSDLYTIARVSCFKDNTTPYQKNSLAIKTNSGYNWRDPENIRWASPASEEMRAYLTGVCVELAKLGFDEILLDNAGYPTEGNLNYIKKGGSYDKAQFSAVVDGFYRQVREALKDYPDVKLSIRTTGGVLDGTDGLSGQTSENLATADRLWSVEGKEWTVVE